jgi:parallel beta-helix repeat protein
MYDTNYIRWCFVRFSIRGANQPIYTAHSNQIYNNSISDSGNGIYVNSGSSNNKLYDNTLTDSTSHAILVNNGSIGNIFYSNKVVSVNKEGLETHQDPTSKNNVLSNNQVINSASPNNAITPEIEKLTEAH